jgi:quercetin dioxygenase-like cupin family protein
MKLCIFTRLKIIAMKIIALADVEKKQVMMEGAKDAWKQLPLGSNDGVPVYSYRVFTVEPGGHTPYHSHPYEHMNFVIEGEGAIVNAAGEEKPIKKGSFALVSPDEKHQYKNTSPDKPFVMICGVPKEFE